MKIVLDARYVRERPSGIGAYVSALATRLPARDPEDHFEFWTHPNFKGVLSTTPNARQLTTRAHPNGLRTLLSPRPANSLEHADLFHSPHNTLAMAVHGTIVVTVHDLMWLSTPELCEDRPVARAFKNLYWHTSITRALRRATLVLTVSKASADDIVRFDSSLRGRVRVTHNAAEARFRPAANPNEAAASASRTLGTEAPYFLVLGINQPSKNHAHALRAFARARKNGERLVLVQRQRRGSKLARLVSELGLDREVIWRSAIPDQELLPLIQSARALLHPSLAEGFGLPVLEAMACGCPVVAHDIPPLREVLGGAGQLAAVGDVEAFARAMRKVADEPHLRAEMQERGFNRSKEFDWDKTAALTLEAYREAVDLGPRR